MSEIKLTTIKDIAKITGYSTQTVSRVINNQVNVKESTRKIILNAIKEYNYRPNPYARKLIGSKAHKNILLSVKTNPEHNANIWIDYLINKIIASNKFDDVSLIIEHHFHNMDLSSSVINKTSSFVDGVIIFYESENDERIDFLKKQKIPYIVYGQPYNPTDKYVAVDNFNAIMQGVEYLFSKNKFNITFLTANPSPVNTAREEGIIEVYRKHNIPLNCLKIIKYMKNYDDVYTTVTNMIRERNLSDALYISGDEKAIAALKALYDNGIKVPDDISVVGFDDIPISKFFIPALSTVSVDYDLIAKKLLFNIYKMINGENVESIEIGGRFIERESTK